MGLCASRTSRVEWNCRGLVSAVDLMMIDGHVCCKQPNRYAKEYREEDAKEKEYMCKRTVCSKKIVISET